MNKLFFTTCIILLSCFRAVALPVEDCDPVPLPIFENFEGEDFPSLCWVNKGMTPWQKVSSGANPDCVPQDGSGMIMFEAFDWDIGSANLTSPFFLPEGKDKFLSFWIYRDVFHTGDDYLDIFCSEDGILAERRIVFSISRSINQSPVVPAEGWYNYVVQLPCAGMEKAIVTFYTQYFFTRAGNMYIDNISILNEYSAPPENISSSFYEKNGSMNHAHITWEAPSLEGGLTGYNIYRNESLIAENITGLEYFDADLEAGEYIYCVEGVYDSESQPVSGKICTSSLIVTTHSDDSLSPKGVTAKTQAAEWYDVKLSWEAPMGEEALTYATGDAVGGVGAGADFMIAIRFSPEDLAAYDGQYLTAMNFPANESGISYVLKVWEGGSDLNPGNEIHSQVLSTSDLTIGNNIWNSVKLSSPMEIDASQELWLGISYEGGSKAQPAPRDAGPILKEGYSNLVYFNGYWTTSYILNPIIEHNWCLTGVVKSNPDTEDAVGYNIYRDAELMNPQGLITALSCYDTAPGAGSYSYGISAVYDNHKESQPTLIDVLIEESPCEVDWDAPIAESFEGSRFPTFCWENISESGTPFTRVSIISLPTNPACEVHTGDNMLQFRSRTYAAGSKSLYASPVYNNENDYTLSFWMYRDAGYPDREDKINVYLSESGEIGGSSPVLTVHRSMELSPQAAEEGWYQYTVELNNAANRVWLEAIGAQGNNIYIDDIGIYDKDHCNIIENLRMAQPKESDVNLSWRAPSVANPIGYKILRDNVVIADNHPNTYYNEFIPVGIYDYTIIALYEGNDCNESEPISITEEVYKQCDPISELNAALLYGRTVEISWTAPTAIDIVSYSLYRDDVLVDDVTQTSYIDEDVEAGNHTYMLVVNYSGKESATSTPVYSDIVKVDYCVSIHNLQADVDLDNVSLSWEYAGGDPIYDLHFYEGFNAMTMPADWLNLDRDGDGYLWRGPFYGVYGMCVYSESVYLQDALYPDNWLISPAIELTGVEYLEYYVRTYSAEWPVDHYGVYISATGTDYDDFTLLFEETLAPEHFDWQERIVDLSDYEGTVHIAFRHFDSSFEWAVLIDEIKIFKGWGGPSFDVYRDDVLLANVSDLSYVDNNIEENKEYTYCVRSVYNSCEVEPQCKTVKTKGTSIYGIAADNIVAYPNPASDLINIEGGEIAKVDIYNALGQLIDTVKNVDNNSILTINTRSYPAGVYAFRIHLVDNMTINKSIIIK